MEQNARAEHAGAANAEELFYFAEALLLNARGACLLMPGNTPKEKNEAIDEGFQYLKVAPIPSLLCLHSSSVRRQKSTKTENALRHGQFCTPGRGEWRSPAHQPN